MAPRTFKILELSLRDVFEALALIHHNSFEVFNTLLDCFPKDHFIGVIEDTFGVFFDDDSEKLLHQRVDKMCRDM